MDQAPAVWADKVFLPVNKNRPVNLDLSTIKLPPAALASILHRVSGVILFPVVALLLYALQLSLESRSGFATVADAFNSLPVKLVLWVSLAALIYHLLAGVRHLLMDLGIGESLEGGRFGALLVLALSAILILLTGFWLW